MRTAMPRLNLFDDDWREFWFLSSLFFAMGFLELGVNARRRGD